ncbi:UBP25 hydrolase, partial [Chloropsis cyanopogon]|nr:UBP25 hydrolase [Chloropsis cyanopogon]
SDVIDLTGDDKDDLQRAIALSLEESNRAFRETGITDEEQAISRVLEASIAENKASLKRTHPEVWSDSPNPYDRKRQDNCPVGLKNVGNTCWFSAVIQSLFNLLEFRRLVLNFNPPANAQDLPRNQKEHRNLPFMRELRYLFALLVGSKRKYVDPSRAVEILKDAFKSNDSQQQDVSEFTHKLLDWLEDAFQIKAEEERDGEKPKNPMVELFYGRFLAVGVLEGKKFENTEMFGQYPLQVNGFKDLHECLEAAMIEGEIESLHSENSAKSGQEHWFTELPPVLTFELSRFEFNQALGRPEKIHNKLEFPPILYLDRYMHKNREITRIKRDEIKRLKEYLTVLQQRLERYLSYGSGPKRFPLVDVLQYALEFASSKPVCTSPVDDLGASAPSSGTLPPQIPPSTIEQQGPSSSDVPSTSPVQRSVIHKPFTQSRIPPDLPMHPAPRHITEEELSVLEGCLHRWRTEVENDTRDLQESISRIHRTIELMYSDKTMVQVPYRLHAVLVHEGQANAGHYWAYIYDHHQNRWMKYNDISVTKSTWEELERDSFGGYRNASAYCLMYINDKEQYLIQETILKAKGRLLNLASVLISWLSEFLDYVKEDNKRFEKELEEWDAELAQKAQQEKLLSQIPRAPAPSPAP